MQSLHATLRCAIVQTGQPAVLPCKQQTKESLFQFLAYNKDAPGEPVIWCVSRLIDRTVIERSR
jgi:hypothetical protein